MSGNRVSNPMRLTLLALLAALLALAPASCGGGSSGSAEEGAAGDDTASQTQPAQPVEDEAQNSPGADPKEEAADPPTEDAGANQPDPAANEPDAVVERFMAALKEGRFDDALALCDPNATGAFELRRQIEGMNNAREAVGEVMYTTAVSHITSSLAEVIWRVMSVDDTRAIVAYTGPRDDHEEAQFEVRLINGRWLVAPPPEGMPIPKIRRR